MESHFIGSIVCPACGADLAPRADRCLRCGAATSAARDADTAPVMAELSGSAPDRPLGVDRAGGAGAERPYDRWLDNPWFIAGMLFLAALFLGLPWLWKSRAFSKPMKGLLTVLVLLETVLVFWGFYVAMAWSYARIKAAL